MLCMCASYGSMYMLLMEEVYMCFLWQCVCAFYGSVYMLSKAVCSASSERKSWECPRYRIGCALNKR